MKVLALSLPSRYLVTDLVLPLGGILCSPKSCEYKKKNWKFFLVSLLICIWLHHTSPKLIWLKQFLSTAATISKSSWLDWWEGVWHWGACISPTFLLSTSPSASLASGSSLCSPKANEQRGQGWPMIPDLHSTWERSDRSEVWAQVLWVPILPLKSDYMISIFTTYAFARSSLFYYLGFF